MSIPGEKLIIYFIDQFMQEVKKNRELLRGVEDTFDLMVGDLGMINAKLEDSEREHDHEVWMATKVEVIKQMRGIVFKAEHVIDKYIYHQIMQNRRSPVTKPIHQHELVDIARKIAAKRTEMEEIDKNRERFVPEQAAAAVDEAQRAVLDRSRVEKKDAVGLNGHTNEWVQNLTNPQYSEGDVLIMGMGGLGKSKLAREIFDRIGTHFDCQAWVYGYPEFKSRDWLVNILDSVKPRPGLRDRILEMMFTSKINGTHEKLAKTLEKRLHEKRYLVVLDGMWDSSDEWKTIKSAFPNGQSGSRILITSRGGVLTASATNQYFFLPLLEEDDSWTLLCNQVFPGGQCDDTNLKEEGKALAAECKGVPLSVIVLGELLLQNVLPGSPHSVETWQGYRQHVNSTLIRKPTRCLSVLAESYQRLPDPQLQSCFLYLSLFPEDYVHSARHLKQLWSAEGLILDASSRDMLDVAENCLLELVNRSLIQVVSKGSEAKVKTCGVHSILRELSRYNGEREKFVELRLDNERASSNSRGRRLSLQGDILEHICLSDYNSASARSLLLFNDTSTTYSFDETKYWKRVSQSFIYVRVLYLCKVPIRRIPDEIENLIFLTNITILGDDNLEIDEISDSICNLEHLETINIDGRVTNCLPEIWKMKKLRHLRVSNGLRLPTPPKGLKKNDKLRILSGVIVEENMAHSIFTGVEKLHLVYVANKQNQQVVDAAKLDVDAAKLELDAAKLEVDEARQKFQEAQKKKAQKEVTKAEEKVKKAQEKVNKAEEKAMEAQKEQEAQESKLHTDALKSLENFSALKSLKIHGFKKIDEKFDYKFPSTLEKLTFVSSYLSVDYLTSILEKLINKLRILKVRGQRRSDIDHLKTVIIITFPTLKVSI